MKMVIPTGLLTLSFLFASCDSKSKSNAVSGTIETDEVRVASRYGGRVEKLFFQEGDTLKSGQVIAELEASELPARRERIAAQLAELEAGARPQELAAAKADWEAQVANLDQARADAKRAEELFAGKTISITERDQAATRAQWLDKIVAANKSRYELLQAGARPEQIAQVRAQLAELETQVREMKITAPADCILETLQVKVGDVLSPNQSVATLLLTNHIWVRVFVPETWLGHIKLGDVARVRVDGFAGKDFSGSVEQIARAAEFTPRNVQTAEERTKQVFGVKLRLENAAELRAGMSAEVEFPGVLAR